MNFLSQVLCMVIESEKCIDFFNAMVSQLTLTGITGPADGSSIKMQFISSFLCVAFASCGTAFPRIIE